MCAQLGLEVICKRSKKEGISSNYHEFWNEEIHYLKGLQKRRALIFEISKTERIDTMKF
jgi:hypothetical protein